MKPLNPVQTFIVFSLEAYKNALNITGEKALADFRKHGVFKFLEDGFDVLHTQSMSYVTDEIIAFIQKKK